MKKLLLLLAIFIASPLMGQNADTSTGQARRRAASPTATQDTNQTARPARRQAANPAVAQETNSTEVQETNSIEVKETKKKPIKSIVSFNYTMGGHDISGYTNMSAVPLIEDVYFQMGGNVEYILGKQWHWYLGVGALSLDYYNISIHTGFGVSFVDTRDDEGLGWMFDWNILTVGTALSGSGYWGLMGTSNVRVRYLMSKYFGIQMGWDVHLYWLEYDYVSSTTAIHTHAIEIYTGISFGLAFGR